MGQVTVAGALQAALAAENAAIFGYGVAGAHLSGQRWTAAQRAWAAHETARDSLTQILLARGSQPVPAAGTYQMPFGVRTPAAATALAAYLEDRVAAAFLTVVALPEPALRAFGARSVRSAALRAAQWRGASLAFPGLELPVPAPATTAPGHGSASPPAGPSPARSSPARSSPASPGPTGRG
jgi:uncharacterized protein DUF4439